MSTPIRASVQPNARHGNSAASFHWRGSGLAKRACSAKMYLAITSVTTVAATMTISGAYAGSVSHEAQKPSPKRTAAISASSSKPEMKPCLNSRLKRRRYSRTRLISSFLS